MQSNLLDPLELKEKFEFLKDNMFLSSNDGRTLANSFQYEFKVFNEDNVANIDELLRAIIDDPSLTEGKFELISDSSRLSNGWDDLRSELISRNRFFPRTKIFSSLFRGGKSDELIVFELLLSQLTTKLPIGCQLFRARITDQIQCFPQDLDKPPSALAGDGRANPAGISYLYCSTDRDTALTEVRPSTGSVIYLADLKTKRSVNLLDLTSPRRMFSAFHFPDNLAHLALELIVLLEKLSEELTAPVAEAKQLSYLPTQFFCEFIKSQEQFDGIKFLSSLTKQPNVVLFCEDSNEAVHFERYEKCIVRKTTHEFNHETSTF
ncbi:RES family NAD+ phosphorylase [Halioxenophilus aromaticivorans]